MPKHTSPKRRRSSSGGSSGSAAERRRQNQRDKEKEREKDDESHKEKERDADKSRDREKDKEKEREKDKEKDRDRDRDRRGRSSSGKSRSRRSRRSRPRRSHSKKSRCPSRAKRSRSGRSRSVRSPSKHRSKRSSRRSRSKRSRSKRSRSKRSRSKGHRSKRSRSRGSRAKRSRSKTSGSKGLRSKRSRSKQSRAKRSRSKRSRSKRSRSNNRRSKRSRSKRSRSKRSRSKRSKSCGSRRSSIERKKEKKRKKKEAAQEKAKLEELAAEALAKAAAAAPPAKKPLGDLVELQKQLEEEREKLQLFILKAKQEHEEKRETDDRRERREREYYKPSWGEPVGPENRFLLEGELGKGAFSTVFRCRDALKGGEYAVKFIRMNAMLRKATEKEVKLMRRLRTLASEQDPEGARFFLGLAGPEVFEHSGHLAVVFQLQRCDLRSGLHKYGQGKGLPLTLVQCYAENIFLALRALRKVNIIHSDVKPDNLLITLDKASVKLSDFGSAMGVAERVKTDYVQPRFYRAPEVILGQAYGTEIDTWSAALTLFELATGRIVFQGRTNNDMIHEMLKVNGAFPKKFATSGEFAARHFTKEGDFKCQEPGPGLPEATMPMANFPKPPQPPQPFLQLLEEHIKEPPAGSDAGRHQARLRKLADFLSRCVVPTPAARLTPQTALAHALMKRNSAA